MPHKIGFSLKLLSHTPHWNGFYSVCDLICFTSVPFLLYIFSHRPHWKWLVSVSPLCILKCLTRLLFSLKLLSHSPHWNVFSCVCVLICFTTVSFLLHIFSHRPHWKWLDGGIRVPIIYSLMVCWWCLELSSSVGCIKAHDSYIATVRGRWCDKLWRHTPK